MRQLLLSTLLILFYSMSLTKQTLATEPNPNAQREAVELYSKVMSPYCPGVTLSACTSGKAKTLRDDIKSWLDAGATKPQVEKRLVSMYGQGIWGMPSTEGFQAVGWLMPIAVVVIGALLIWFALSRMILSSDEDDELDLELDPETIRKVEAELQKRTLNHES